MIIKKLRQILNILPRKFYQKDTVIVAKRLLGKKLVRKQAIMKFQES